MSSKLKLKLQIRLQVFTPDSQTEVMALSSRVQAAFLIVNDRLSLSKQASCSQRIAHPRMGVLIAFYTQKHEQTPEPSASHKKDSLLPVTPPRMFPSCFLTQVLSEANVRIEFWLLF